jgi:hypothetical protein
VTEEMVRYYARRAEEYDRIYDIPPWRRGAEVLRQRLPGVFRATSFDFLEVGNRSARIGKSLPTPTCVE